MNRFELVVFDWDGTLMDSGARIVTAVQRAIEVSRLPPRSPEQIRDIIGLGMREAVAALFPDTGARARQRLLASYQEAFVRAVAERDATVFPGVANTLRALEAEGRMLAIATGKSRTGLQRDLERAGLGHHFVASRTVDEAPSKPHPAMLEAVMQLCDVEPASTVLVGDTLYDLEMAARAGVPALGVAWGVQPAERLAAVAPLGVIDGIDALAQRLQAWESAAGSASPAQ